MLSSTVSSISEDFVPGLSEYIKEYELANFTSLITSLSVLIFANSAQYSRALFLQVVFSKNSKELNRNFYNFISSVADAYADGKDLEDLINEIRSPKGTTHAGIISLKRDKVKNKIDKAFKAAELRSKEIQNEYK